MAEYDGLPLDTPTLVAETDDHEVWATRTANGGTVEHRIKTGSNADVATKREQRIAAAIPVLRQWANDAETTTATTQNAVAVLNVVLDRLGVFFDNFADLLESLGKD